MVISHDFPLTMKAFRSALQQLKHKPFNASQQPQFNHCEHIRLYNATNSVHKQHILKFPINTKHFKKGYKSASQLELIDKICKCNKSLVISSLFWNKSYIFANINTIIIMVFFNIRDITSDIRSIPIMFYALQRISSMFFFVLRVYYSFINTIHQIDNIIVFRIMTFTVYILTILVYFISQGLIYYKKLQTISITIAVAFDMLWNTFFAIFFGKKLRQVKEDGVVNGQNFYQLYQLQFARV